MSLNLRLCRLELPSVYVRQARLLDNGAIAGLLVDRFPHRFPDRRTALGRVGDLAIRYADPRL